MRLGQIVQTRYKYILYQFGTNVYECIQVILWITQLGALILTRSVSRYFAIKSASNDLNSKLLSAKTLLECVLVITSS